MQNDFYTHKLYSLQDKVLAALSGLPVDFYLTGGTALSRAFFNHRYSDDLDFFLNWNPRFSEQFEIVFKALKEFNVMLGVKSDSFARCFVIRDDVNLKLDFVNDVSFRKDTPIRTDLFCRTDCVMNILTNKISALSRNEPKDISDIIEISLHEVFNWVDIISDAKQKDLNVDELDVARHIAEFDVTRLTAVNWITPQDFDVAAQRLKIISQDIFLGNDNSLFNRFLSDRNS